MQSQHPTGERQAPNSSHSSTHPTQAQTSHTNHPSLPSLPSHNPNTPTSPANQITPSSPLFSTQNQVVVLPRPRPNVFAQNKPFDPNHPLTTPDRNSITGIQVNSKALSEGHKATQQTLRNEADGVHAVDVPGVGKRLVRRSNPPSPLSTPGAGAGTGMLFPMGLMTPSPARVRNTVFSPFKIPSSNLSPKSSLEAIKESGSEEQPTQDKVAEEGKGEKGEMEKKEEQQAEEEYIRARLELVDEDDRRIELENRHSPPASNVSRDGLDQTYNHRSDIGQHTIHPNDNSKHDDRVAAPRTRELGNQKQQSQRRSDQSIPRDITNLRSEQHRYHNQTQGQSQNQGHHDSRQSHHSRGQASSHFSHSGQESVIRAAKDPHGQQWDDRRPDSRARIPSGQQEYGQARPQHQQDRYPNPRQLMSKDAHTSRPRPEHQQHHNHHHQDRYGPVFDEGEDDQDPFIDHASPPKPSRKRSRPQEPHHEPDTRYQLEHEHENELQDQDQDQHQDRITNKQISQDQDREKDREQGPAPKRLREQATQTQLEEPSSEAEAEEGSEAETVFDPTAPIEPYDYIGQIQEPWNEAMSKHVPYLDEWAERFISTSIDYVLAVYKCSHKSSVKLGESLQEGVDEILAQQAWQNDRRQTFIDFRKQMAKVAQALGDIDPEDEEMHVSTPKNRV